MKTIAVALLGLAAWGAGVAAVSTTTLAEAELTELAFRADLHAATMAALDADLDRAHASLSSAADEASHEAMHAATETDARAAGAMQAAAATGWRYGGNYAPQSYGQWRMARGTWSFGGDKRIECEACSYVTYFLIDRLGDQFSRATIKTELELLCPRVQWVFRSTCDWLRQQGEVVADLIMKLIEPVDICKHLTACPPDWYDLMGVGGMNGYGLGRWGATAPVGAGGGIPMAPPGVLPRQWATPFGGAYMNPAMAPFPAGGYDGYGAPRGSVVGGGTGAPAAAGAAPAAAAPAAAPAAGATTGQ